MMNLPSLTTMRECLFETFPLGSTISLPLTRPIVTSVLSKVVVVDGPPFSLMVTLNMSAGLS